MTTKFNDNASTANLNIKTKFFFNRRGYFFQFIKWYFLEITCRSIPGNSINHH